jgi:serine/threonine protein phosphatase PrpC
VFAGCLNYPGNVCLKRNIYFETEDLDFYSDSTYLQMPSLAEMFRRRKSAVVTDDGAALSTSGESEFEQYLQTGEASCHIRFPLHVSLNSVLEILNVSGNRINFRPARSFDEKVSLIYDFDNSDIAVHAVFRLICHPDPRLLWKSIPVSDDAPFQKININSAGIDLPDGKKLAAASIRGRLHANSGRFREDHFAVQTVSGMWTLMAVADGAGSAVYSREGSRIACETFMDRAAAVLGDQNSKINVFLRAEKSEASRSGIMLQLEECMEILGNVFYDAAVQTRAEILRKAEGLSQDTTIRDFDTTLLFVCIARIPQGYFIFSFSVGDCTAAVYTDDPRYFKVMNIQDTGDFAGETNFLTCLDLTTAGRAGFVSRTDIHFVPDFRAVCLMTDGLSDPIFESSSEMLSYSAWKALWNSLMISGESHLDPSVSTSAADNAERLRKWLGFWSRGYHDDRTLVVVYRPE